MADLQELSGRPRQWICSKWRGMWGRQGRVKNEWGETVVDGCRLDAGIGSRSRQKGGDGVKPDYMY